MEVGFPSLVFVRVQFRCTFAANLSREHAVAQAFGYVSVPGSARRAPAVKRRSVPLGDDVPGAPRVHRVCAGTHGARRRA